MYSKIPICKKRGILKYGEQLPKGHDSQGQIKCGLRGYGIGHLIKKILIF